MSDATTLFVLLESSAGYALFEVVAFDEIGSLLTDDTVTDLKRFGRAVKLTAFGPFSSAAEALENAHAISEHAVTGTLHNFLELHLPSLSKKKSNKTAPFALGVVDPALATAIQASLASVSCRSDDTIREIHRGCRLHLETFVKGLSEHASSLKAAQLGLGHAYSRSRVKFNPARSDNMIIQSIALLDQLDKDVNTFAMRVREWYSWHFPELKEIVKDNVQFARAAALIQDKNSLFTKSNSLASKNGGDSDDKADGASNAKIAQLIEVVGVDADVAQQIVAAAKTSMGMDCSPIDMLNICNFTQRMVKLAEYRHQLSLYLTEKMNMVAPNLAALIGDSVAARLISKAGSLTNLAKAPASTVQILGAEKALFRALKTKGNTPKYGLIYHSTFIGRADAKNKGRISRYLANKCSIATRIDTFQDVPSNLYGQHLRSQVEERLKFYETGTAPRRNIQVMEEAAKELAAGHINEDDVEMKRSTKNEDKKKAKKEKKRKSTDAVDVDNDDEAAKKLAKEENKKKPKKEEKRKSDDMVDLENDDEAAKKSAKKAKKEKKKKRKSEA